MSVVTKDILKTYFETGDYPTHLQFANLIDSLRHVNDKIDESDLTDTLISVINSMGLGSNPPIITEPGAATVLIPRNTLIDVIVVLHSNDTDFSAGWEDGAEDVVDGFHIPNSVSIIQTGIYQVEDRILYLNNVTESTVVKLYKR